MRLYTTLLPLISVTLACALAQELPLAGIHHIGIQVSNLEKARWFYQGVLGFEPAFQLYKPDMPREVATAFYKVSDDQFIELFPGLKPDQVFRINHFSLRTRDIQRVHAMLERRGLKPTEVQTGPEGNLHFDFRDPDAHRIQVTQIVPGSMHSRIYGEKMTDSRVSRHLRHVAVPVADLSRAIEFYYGTLGFQLIGETGIRGNASSQDVRVPGEQGDFLRLVLIPPDLAPGKAGSLEYLCLDVQDPRVAHKTLVARGIHPQDHGRELTIADPDGTRVTLTGVAGRGH
jgi:catechol 2,3-dioxygenase-like lactoylglutathione lyase family enzyme